MSPDSGYSSKNKSDIRFGKNELELEIIKSRAFIILLIPISP